MVFSQLDEFLDCNHILVFEEVADLFESANSFIWAMHDDVVDQLHQVLVQICSILVLGTL